jgi:hypothetical protein
MVPSIMALYIVIPSIMTLSKMSLCVVTSSI